ncbi:MAG: tRNA 2-selenouridine(34) synthase MnmH [Chromatiales bacterium]|nr:tRNA 2-selenouridine(34) synthase MnmH [Chromatiales bacterium]
MEFSDLPEIDDFRSLIVNDTPLLDVRAPVEFAQGTLPTAENQPFINDEERHEIGLRYAELGQDAAIDLGHELVKGELKDQRVAKWRQFAETHPEGILFCWRGGMRSKFSQQWLFDATGIRYPRIKGGYKALRRFLLEEIELISPKLKLFVVGGRTGVGKTIFLNNTQNSIDLEGMANHRGSAFGVHPTPQPAQADFDNRVATELIKHHASNAPYLLVEDEGRNIGGRHVPVALHNEMINAPRLMLDISVEERINITHQEYIHEALAEYCEAVGDENGFDAWAEYLLGSLDKIRKRLGGQRHQELRTIMEKAIDEQRNNGDSALHRDWIKSLLVDYYDPMYDYQLSQKEKTIIFTGSPIEIQQYLDSL